MIGFGTTIVMLLLDSIGFYLKTRLSFAKLKKFPLSQKSMSPKIFEVSLRCIYMLNEGGANSKNC